MSGLKYDFGRQAIKPVKTRIAAQDEPRNQPAVPSCAKCRHLVIKVDGCACGRGRSMDAAACPEFRDASQQRDGETMHDYSGRFRR